jgi:hypothetical protein
MNIQFQKENVVNSSQEAIDPLYLKAGQARQPHSPNLGCVYKQLRNYKTHSSIRSCHPHG